MDTKKVPAPMPINRVLVLGIDALEYDLVDKWKLTNLQQREYGKTALPICKGEDPNTRIIWPCFITGKGPREMGYVTSRIFKPPFQLIVNIIAPRIKIFLQSQVTEDQTIKDRKKSVKINFLNKSYGFLEKIGLTEKPSRKHIKASTMFDSNTTSRIHFNIPIYDEYLPAYSNKTVEAIENKLYRPIFENLCKKEFDIRSANLIACLQRREDWELCMQYFWCLDGIQHVFFNNPKKIATFYIMFDEFVGKIKKMLNDETLLLIISDHGQKKGIHTPYGFYSVNKHLGLKNPKITDFRWIIEDLLK